MAPKKQTLDYSPPPKRPKVTQYWHNFAPFAIALIALAVIAFWLWRYGGARE